MANSNRIAAAGYFLSPAHWWMARLIHERLGVNMVCGAGNISFGLPERPPLTAAFLAMAMTHGLTCAITDVTNETIRQAVKGSDVLLGRDEYAMNWIADYRNRQKEK
jgi:5-methyltetrahydrofolate--homocysteine methyltransferase